MSRTTGQVGSCPDVQSDMLFVIKFSDSLTGLNFILASIIKWNLIYIYIDHPGGNDV